MQTNRDDFPLDPIDKAEEEMNEAITPMTLAEAFDQLGGEGPDVIGEAQNNFIDAPAPLYDDDEVMNIGPFPVRPSTPEGPATPEQEALRAQVEETIEAQRKLEEDTSAITPKRSVQLEKLRVLGQDLLDLIYQEWQFNNDPRFKDLHEIMDKNEEPTEQEATFITNKLKEMGTAAMIEFMTQALALPMKRAQARAQYVEYRDMLQDFS